MNRYRVCLLATLGLVLVGALSTWAVEGDIVFKRPGVESAQAAKDETPVAVFPHWFHRIRYKCYVCHPAIFAMKAGADKVTMDAIVDGKFCGTCHNDKIAWGVGFNTCDRCHRGP